MKDGQHKILNNSLKYGHHGGWNQSSFPKGLMPSSVYRVHLGMTYQGEPKTLHGKHSKNSGSDCP